MVIFNIQRYSTHDGEGIRTVIFFKGCTLRCAWCSNPESQTFSPEKMFNEKLCIKIGDCLKQPPEPCPALALTTVGEDKSTAELIYEIEKDINFYNQSAGGVTLSGGEPFAQDHKLIELIAELQKRQIHVTVETSLHTKWSIIKNCMGLIQTFLVDLKHLNAAKFRKYTGGSLNLILSNLERLVDAGEHVIVRIPVIPEFNHTTREVHEIIDYAISLEGIQEVHFIPYHVLGVDKYRMLGRKYPFVSRKAVDVSELTEYMKYAHSKGLKTRIGG